MALGGGEKILDLHDLLMAKEFFLLGALIIIGLFFLAVYILRREFRYSLYFACLCLFMAVSLDMVGQFILPRLIPGRPFSAVIFTWYTATTWIVFFLILYVHELFKSRFSRWILRAYFGFSLALQLLYLFTPSTFYTRFAAVCNYTDIAAVLCVVVVVASGIKKGTKDGWLHISGMLIISATYIHDILYWTNLITSRFGELIYAGLFGMIFLQMIAQARRIRFFYDEKAAAELSFLQSQIKPHFLYNTLNTFISMSYYDPEKARMLLHDFTTYLRNSFDFKDLSQLVPLRREIELAEVYCKIEQARFEERLEVNFSVCDVPEAMVPLLVLQPVIENAIIHGVLPQQEGGRVEVSVKQEKNRLVFKVADNGKGIESEQIAGILEKKPKNGIALSNIDNRLKRLYGKGLIIISVPGGGTEVAWCIPLSKRG